MKSSYQTDICTPMFFVPLFVIAKIWTQPRCPEVGEWIKKMQCILIMEYFSALQKEQNPVIYNKMNGSKDHSVK
jgi:hypothetical protein